MSEANGYATRESVLGSPYQRRYADHEQKFNGQVRKFRLQSLHDGEKGDFDADAVNSKGKFKRQSVATANARIIALCCVDDAGRPLFGAADVPTLQQYDSGEVEKLAAACRQHCGWEEEPEKNSDTIDVAASPTS